MTIKDIYHGNRAPIDMQFDTNSRYVGLSKEWLRLHEEFKGTLSAEQNEMFNKLCDIQGEQNCISNERSYKQGFCDGAELMRDIIEGGD